MYGTVVPALHQGKDFYSKVHSAFYPKSQSANLRRTNSPSSSKTSNYIRNGDCLYQTELDDANGFARRILMTLWCDFSCLHARSGSEKLLCGLKERKISRFCEQAP